MSYFNTKDIEQLAVLLVDSIGEHIAVITPQGFILFVNQAWVDFSVNNASEAHNGEWLGINYLDVCERAAVNGNPFGKREKTSIRNTLSIARRYSVGS